MIRFSAFLVAVAVGLLVAGVVTSKLMLVYVAIGVSGVALLALAIGAVVKRRELFGSPEAARAEPLAVPVPAAGFPPVQPSPAQPSPAWAQPQISPWPATAAAGSGPSRPCWPSRPC